MNVSRAHEYYDITDTYQNKEVTGGCTFVNSENLTVNLTIKDTVDKHVNAYLMRNPDALSLSVSCDGTFDASIGKYVIDIIQAILNDRL